MKKIQKIYNFLSNLNPDAKSELNFENNYQLLIAVVLSAQCTDKRVNEITPTLFDIAPTPKDMTKLSQKEIIDIIHSCGFFNSKSKSIMEASKDLVEKFGGQVPSNFNDLISLRGVGRKTANVVLNVGFGLPSIAVDTHVLRVSKRLGLCNESDDPLECEQKLNNIFDKNQKKDISDKIILFGRYLCKAKNPECTKCELQNFCKYYNMNSDKL